MDVAIEVQEDGSGSLDAAVVLDVERLGELSGMFTGPGGLPGSGTVPGSPEEFCDEFLSGGDVDEDLPPGAQVRLVNEPGRCAVELSLSWAAGEVVPGLGAVVDAAPWLLEREGDGWRFSMDTGSLQSGMVGEDALGGLSVDMVRMFAGEMTLDVSVDLPGSVQEHNGELRDGVVSWEMDLLDPEPTAFFAVSGPAKGSAPPWWVFGAGAAAVLGVYAAMRRRGRRVGAVDASGSASADLSASTAVPSPPSVRDDVS